jgi:uncharacterized protein
VTHLTLVLTHDCNLACGYCFAGEKRRQRMSDDVLARSLDMAFVGEASRPSPSPDGARKGDETTIGLFGGEPTLAWDLVERVVTEAEARGPVSFTMTTNATLIDDERAAFCAEHGVHVAVSIDGDRAVHDGARPTRGGRGSFDKTLAGLRRLQAAGATVETISVVDPSTVRWLADSVGFLGTLGVERVSLNPSFGSTFSDEDLHDWEAGYRAAAALYVERMLAGRPISINVIEDKILTHVKDGYGDGERCEVADHIAVSPSGNLYPCARLVGEDRDDKLRIGDVFRGVDLGRLALLRAQAAGDDGCDGCGVERRCLKSCACANYEETGEVGIPGGLQCWHEQMSMRVADEAGTALWRARDRRFVARVYGGVL